VGEAARHVHVLIVRIRAKALVALDAVLRAQRVGVEGEIRGRDLGFDSHDLGL
jgi:hypothetical protein